MLDILLVDDEPAVVRYLRALIELRCEGLKVVAVAENGQEALALVEKLKPDLVITDIRMPVMDGLELVIHLKDSYPELPVVIVSGYQEFEYARQALATGVVDYLIKPVKLLKLQQVLEKLRPSVEAYKTWKKATYLQSVIDGAAETASDGELPCLCYLGVYRSHGLPMRFSHSSRPSPPRYVETLYILPGRDAHEQVFLADEPSFSYDEFFRRVSEQVKTDAVSSSVLLFFPKALEPSELANAMRQLEVGIDCTITPEVRTVSTGKEEQPPDTVWDPLFTNPSDYLVDTCHLEELQAVAADLVARWKERGTRLRTIEAELREYLQYLAHKKNLGLVPARIEVELDRAMADAQTFVSLEASVSALFATMISVGHENGEAPEVPVLFNEIKAWIHEHFDQPLSLPSVARKFRISESYVSKLFRRYADRTFNEVLTDRRMEVAKNLIRQAPDLPFKDIAQRVGYQDQFYFSRVFKTVEGIPPKVYADRMRTARK